MFMQSHLLPSQRLSDVVEASQISPENVAVPSHDTKGFPVGQALLAGLL
jgi:hypothetical protein